MADGNKTENIHVHALLLADNIYQDRTTGKYIIAGTFQQVNVSEVPITFGRTIGLFISISGLAEKTDISLEFVDDTNEKVLLTMGAIEITCQNPETVVEMALEIPPLPLSREGKFLFRLIADKIVVGTAPVFVHVRKDEQK